MKQELLKIMKERRSVRSYKKDLMIPEDVLQEILETATYAPTGGHRSSLQLQIKPCEITLRI